MYGTLRSSTGKWYFEEKIVSFANTSYPKSGLTIGWADKMDSQIHWYPYNGDTQAFGVSGTNLGTIEAGETAGVAIDMDA
jgi:hypothetical protein